MRVMRYACAVSLSAGIALSAGSAFAGAPGSDIFEGFWTIEDSKEPNTVQCTLEMFDTDLSSNVVADGVGTGGAIVVIDVFSTEPTDTNRDTKQGRVRQDRYAQLDIRFDGVSTLGGGVYPEKCKIDVKVNGDKGKGEGTVNCKGDGLNTILTANEIASIQAAFVNSKQVKFKTNDNKQTWDLSMKCKGDAFNED